MKKTSGPTIQFYKRFAKTDPAIKPQAPNTNKILNTAEPTIVPMPTLDCAIKVPINDVKSSGAEPPAAMKVDTAFEYLEWN